MDFFFLKLLLWLKVRTINMPHTTPHPLTILKRLEILDSSCCMNWRTKFTSPCELEAKSVCTKEYTCLFLLLSFFYYLANTSYTMLCRVFKGSGVENRRFIQNRYSKPNKIWIHFSLQLDTELQDNREIRQALQEPKLADVMIASLHNSLKISSIIFEAQIWQRTHSSRKYMAHRQHLNPNIPLTATVKSAGCSLPGIHWD